MHLTCYWSEMVILLVDGHAWHFYQLVILDYFTSLLYMVTLAVVIGDFTGRWSCMIIFPVDGHAHAWLFYQLMVMQNNLQFDDHAWWSCRGCLSILHDFIGWWSCKTSLPVDGHAWLFTSWWSCRMIVLVDGHAWLFTSHAGRLYWLMVVHDDFTIRWSCRTMFPVDSQTWLL